MATANLEFLHAPFPVWLGALFIGCTAYAAALLGRIVQGAEGNPRRYWQVVGAWLLLQAGLSMSGFYQTNLGALPPRLVVGGILPTVLVVLGLLVSAAGRRWLARLPLGDLAAISVVRIGVEVGLYGLAAYHLVPEIMTFAGRNLDVLAGITAPIVAARWRNRRLGRTGLLIWNVASLALLGNIVVLALLASPSPVQQFAFEQPNVAVLRFPFVWLPTFIVPLVLFSHVASLYQLWRRPVSAHTGSGLSANAA